MLHFTFGMDSLSLEKAFQQQSEALLKRKAKYFLSSSTGKPSNPLFHHRKISRHGTLLLEVPKHHGRTRQNLQSWLLCRLLHTPSATALITTKSEGKGGKKPTTSHSALPSTVSPWLSPDSLRRTRQLSRAGDGCR